MKKWLEEIVTSLQHMKNSQHQFISALCVACSLQLCHLNYSLKKKVFLFPLLKMLQLKPVAERGMCPDYSYVCHTLTNKSFRYEIDNVYRYNRSILFFGYAHIVGTLLDMQY